MHIGFVGIGKIGWPLAGHLRQAGFALTVTDADSGRKEVAAAAGFAVSDLIGVVRQADVVIASMPNDVALEVVADIVCANGSRGLVLVDTSTVSVAVSGRVAAWCVTAGVEYLRVALSGNTKMAEERTLTVLASGPRPLYERLEPVLKCFGETCFYLGDAEQARLMKLVINLMVGQTAAMLAEALTLGQKGGLAWTDMWQVIASSAVASPLVKAKAPLLVQRDFTPTFSVLQMIKDLTLILEAASHHGVSLRGTDATLKLMHAAVNSGWEKEDYAAVIKVVESQSGLNVR